MTTILLVPDDPASPLLADGPCGSRPPVCYYGPRWHGDVPLGDGWQPVGLSAPNGAPRALVLANGGTVPEGMLRLLLTVTEAMKSTAPDGLCLAMSPTYWIDREEVGDSDFGGTPTYPVAVCVATDGVFWRLDLPDDAPDANDVLIVLAAVAPRLACRVVVLDGAVSR